MKTRLKSFFIALTLIASLTEAMAAVQINTTNLPDGEVNVFYDQSLEASSSNPSFTWSIISNSLPPGLTFDSFGEIYGTPTNTGIYNFTVQVVDGNNKSTNQSLSLIIYSPNPVLSVSAQTSGNHFQFFMSGAHRQTYYTIEFSTNLTGWIPLLTTNLPNGTSLSLNLPMTNKTGFYAAYESAIVVEQSIFQFGTGVVDTPVIYVNVTNGIAVIPITRTSGLSSNVCVYYSTSDGTAMGGCDYNPASGELCFDVGVTSNSFSIPISLGCSATNQSATVNLQISDPNGNNVLNALLVIQRPKPVLAIDTNSLTLVVPENCEQYITISNAGPPGSVLNYTVADDGAFSGFLNLNPYISTFSLASGESAPVPISVLDQFATNWNIGTLTTALNIYTPDAANYVKYPVSVTIETEQTAAQKLLGTWSGTWSGTNYEDNEDTNGVPVSGTWSITFRQIINLISFPDIEPGDEGSAVGTLTVQGTTYYFDNSGDYVPFNFNQQFPFAANDVPVDNGIAPVGCDLFEFRCGFYINTPDGLDDLWLGIDFTMDTSSNTIDPYFNNGYDNYFFTQMYETYFDKGTTGTIIGSRQGP